MPTNACTRQRATVDKGYKGNELNPNDTTPLSIKIKFT